MRVGVGLALAVPLALLALPLAGAAPLNEWCPLHNYPESFPDGDLREGEGWCLRHPAGVPLPIVPDAREKADAVEKKAADVTSAVHPPSPPAAPSVDATGFREDAEARTRDSAAVAGDVQAPAAPGFAPDVELPNFEAPNVPAAGGVVAPPSTHPPIDVQTFVPAASEHVVEPATQLAAMPGSDAEATFPTAGAPSEIAGWGGDSSAAVTTKSPPATTLASAARSQPPLPFRSTMPSGGAVARSAAADGAGPVVLVVLFATAAVALPFVMLYRRILRAQAMESQRRQCVLAYVRAHPGATTADVARELGVLYNAARHHLDILEEFGAVVRRKQAGVRYFENDGRFLAEDQRLRVIALRPENVAFLGAVADGAASRDEVRARLGLSRSGFYKRLAILREAGLVAATPGAPLLTLGGRRALEAASRPRDVPAVA